MPAPASPRFQAHGRRRLDVLGDRFGVTAERRREIEAVAAVLPFRINGYVAEELIDWSAAPEDPIYRLTVPQREMLEPEEFDRVAGLIESGADGELEAAVAAIRERMNPHPAGQHELNSVAADDEPLPGVQHKYEDTVLYFPAEGQTCHAYCAYCFRWAQFVGPRELRFASSEPQRVADYVRSRHRVSDLLVTGGDPLVMRTSVLRRHLEPFLAPDLARGGIRLGTKALSYWPYRFTDGRDADELLRLFEEIVAAGRPLSLMAHYSHPRELSTDAACAALERVRSTGAVVRCQAPVVRGVNDAPEVWADLWNTQVRLGAIPYYMFVERDTGPRRFFELSLTRALEIYEGACRSVSGLARTARGPVMSATPGKVLVDGTVKADGARAFVLRLIRSRDPAQVNTIVLARFDPRATWLDDLRTPGGDQPFEKPTSGVKTTTP